MGRPKNVLYKEDQKDGIIFACPYCSRYVVIPYGKGLQQCFVCGGFVDTDHAVHCPPGKKIKYDGLASWK